MSGFQCIFEGVDCSGKSTICNLISEYLSQQNIKNIITRHPGATLLGQKLREILKTRKYPPNTEGLLFAADNSAYIHQILLPKLEEEYIIIADRNNFISSMAYQIASGCSYNELSKIHNAVTQPPKIDLLFIMDIDWETYQRRVKLRNEKIDAFESRGKGYFNKLTAAYRGMMFSDYLKKFVKEKNGKINAQIIDCSYGIDIVYQKIIKRLNQEF